MAQATPLTATRATSHRRPAPARRGRARSSRCRLTAVGAAVVLAGVLLAGPFAAAAGAHTDVVGVSPAPAEVLDRAPGAVRIWFSGAVDPKLGGIFVYDADGDRVDAGPLRQPIPEKLVLPVTESLADGSYIVTWRAVSVDDGHPVQGTWTFHVGTASTSSADVAAVAADLLADQRADRSVGVAWGIARWAVFAAMALLVGGAAFVAVVWPPARDRRTARVLVWAGWVGLTVATVAGVVLDGAYSRGGSLADAVDADVVWDTLDTRFGHVGLLRLGLLAVAFVALRALLRRPSPDRRPAWWWPVAALTGVGLVATPGLAGHASAGDHRVLAGVADALHVAAMAVWLGGLVVLLAAVLVRAVAPDDVPAVRGAARHFSRVTPVCVAVLVVTGAFQTWRVVGGLAAFRDDEYGRILVVKLVLFAVLLAVASLSREIVGRLRPGVPVVRGGAIALDDAPVPDERPIEGARELRRLRRSVWAEVVLGAAVLAATAVLVNAVPPAGGVGAGPRAGSVAAVTLDDRRVTLDVTAAPGRPGPNDLRVDTYGPDGRPLAVDAVELSLVRPDRNLAPLTVPLRQLAVGHYLSSELDIPLSGVWRAHAVVRLDSGARVDLTGDLEIR